MEAFCRFKSVSGASEAPSPRLWGFSLLVFFKGGGGGEEKEVGAFVLIFPLVSKNVGLEREAKL